jgi:hypothetical protein
VDLLFVSSGIEAEVVDSAECLEVLGNRVPVAQRGHLIALKVLSESESRFRDREDLRALLQSATAADMGEAREAVRLISERGFHRGKELSELLAAFAREFGPGARDPDA